MLFEFTSRTMQGNILGGGGDGGGGGVSKRFY